MRFERAGEVALVVEACLRRDIGDGARAACQSMCRLLQSQVTKVRADGNAEMGSESAGQMNRVHTDRFGDLPDTQVLAGRGVQQVSGLVEPEWASPSDARAVRVPDPSRRGEQFQDEPFQGERSNCV